MQYIPRNELLDKLAAGWKVRRKVWGNNVSLSQNGGSSGWTLCDLLADDWEGEPQGPRRMYEGCAITFAFEKLRGGAAFVRRETWSDVGKCTFEQRGSAALSTYVISLEDILATDWEVWG